MKRFWTAAVTALVVTLGLALVSGSWISTTGGHANMIGPMTMAGNQSPMLTATAADSFKLKMAALSGSGWTATASDQSSGHPAADADAF